MADSVIASVTIQKPGRMTAEERKEIAAWLRERAANLLKYGSKYSNTGPFRARYYQGEVK